MSYESPFPSFFYEHECTEEQKAKAQGSFMTESGKMYGLLWVDMTEDQREAMMDDSAISGPVLVSEKLDIQPITPWPKK